MTMMSRTRVSATRTMAAPANSLLDNDLALVARVQEKRQERRPSEEQDLHDTNCKRRLEHGARLVDGEVQVIVDMRAVRPKWSKRDPD